MESDKMIAPEPPLNVWLRQTWNRHAEYFAGAIIVVAGLVAYANTFGAPFVYDDQTAIIQNTSLHSWATVFTPPHGGVTVEGRPLLNFSFALNYALSGLNPWSYHLVNLLIHLGAGLALFGIVRRTLNATWPAFAAALLWTLDPLQTESVTYISQRAESLMGLFYLLTLYFFVRGTETEKSALSQPRDAGGGLELRAPGDLRASAPLGGASGLGEHSSPETSAPNLRRSLHLQPLVFFTLSVASCLLGMATKEVMVTAPVIVLFFDRAFVAGSFAEAWRRRRLYYLALAATWIPLAALVAGTGGQRGGTAGFGVDLRWGDYLLTQFPAVLRYLGLAVWPHPLVFDYGVYTTSVASAALPALIVLALAGLAGVALVRRPRLGLLGFAFFGILAPTSLVPSTVQTMAEHRLYLSLAAVIAGATAALFRYWDVRKSLALCGTIACIFAGLTFQRNAAYRSPVDLWADTVAKRPNNALAHDNLGTAYFDRGAIPRAAEEFAEAVRLAPDSVYARLNLADALALTGRLAEAIDQGEAAVRLAPGWAGVHCNLGNTFNHAGRYHDAVAQFEQALKIKPDYAQAENGLGAAYFNLGNPDEALRHFEAALRLDPNYAQALNNLGTLLAATNHLADAIVAYQRAVKATPNYPEAHANLGNALDQAGRPAEAVPEFDLALREGGDSVSLRNRLAIALAESGHPQEAEFIFEDTLRQHPGDAETERNLARLKALEKSASSSR